MNPLYPPSSFVEKQKEDQQEVEGDPNLKLYIFSSTSQVVAASSSSSQLAFATCFSTSSATQHDHRQTVNLHLHHHLLQQSQHQLQHDLNQAEKSIGGSREENEVIFSSSSSLVRPSTRETSERSRLLENNQVEDNQMIKKEDHNGAAKYWMSSKMRLMQKMMINTNSKKVINGGTNSNHQKAATRNYNNNNEGDGGKWESMTGKSSSCNSNIGVVHNNGVRVCSDCSTTTTPLWRSGPQGPKSLCNACGIRQRKARRAMAEAANGVGGSVVKSETASGKKEMHKEKKSRLSCTDRSENYNGVNVGDVKNKCNNDGEDQNSNNSESQSELGTMNNEVSFDGTHNFTLRLSKTSGGPSAFGRVFPRDEEEAAILLMELSCGFLHTC